MRVDPSKPYLSLIIPSFEGVEFLSQVLPEVLNRAGSDTEVIVSDGCSTDGTFEYLRKLDDARLKVVSPKSRMSMAEHWNWVSTFATGRWHMFLGQDDFLQFDFQYWVSELIAEAESSSLRVIVAERAYYDWPGSTPEFPRGRAHRHGVKASRIVRTGSEACQALSGLRSYHTIAQMYTSCLVSESLVNEIRHAQGGMLIVAHPQDASLAASVLLRDRYALRSSYPISWVGTSTKSAGLAIKQGGVFGDARESIFTNIALAYTRSIEKSSIAFPEFAGNFTLGENSIYLWQAILVVAQQQGTPIGRNKSLLLLSLALVGCFSRSNLFFQRNRKKLFELRRIASLNKLPAVTFWLVSALGFFGYLGRTAIKSVALSDFFGIQFRRRSRAEANVALRIDDVLTMSPMKLNQLVANSYCQVRPSSQFR